MGLSLISWNVNFANLAHPEGLVTLITEQTPDVVCLQEVPEDMLDTLPEIPGYSKVVCHDRTFRYRRRKIEEYLVIITRCEIVEERCHKLPHTKGNLGVHFGLVTKGVGGYTDFGFQLVSIRYGEELYLIGNVHLPLFTSSRGRISAMEQMFAMVKKTGLKCLLAGDFNILDTPPLRYGIGWFLGIGVTEFGLNERHHMRYLQKRFAYQNPHEGLRTVTRAWLGTLQLDHIMVPEVFSISRKEVIGNTYGSDHHPILVELDDGKE